MTFWVMEKCTFFQMHFLRKKIGNERDMRSSSEMIIKCGGVYLCAAKNGMDSCMAEGLEKRYPLSLFLAPSHSQGGWSPPIFEP